MNVMASSRYASTEGTTNACRACRLLLGPCTDQQRDVLHHRVPPSTFPCVIKQKRSNLPRLTAPQMNLILPEGGSYTGNYNDMDVSLLYILLRNICDIPPHINGWGNDPDPTDRSLSANIERIRIARNQCVHSSSPFLSNADFNTVWSIVKSAVVAIDSFLKNGNKYEKEVEFLRHETMDPNRDSHYTEQLRKQAEEDAETREMVRGMKHEIRNPKSVIPKNVKDIHEKELKRWKKEDVVYSETHSFLSMLEKVRGQPYMTFVGGPGSGKSATIHHIALILQEEGYEVVPIIDIRKIEDYSDSRHPQVFVIDDVVGVHGLQKQKLELLIDYEQRILDPSSKKTKVLMSCRKAVFKECYESFLLNEKNTIKMQNSENALNDEDKKAILQKYGLDRDLLSLSLLRETSGMFPLLCKIYSKGGEEVKKNVGRFFTCPAECILEEFDKMQHRNNLCYATLVLCMLNDNKLSNTILENTENEVFCKMKSSVLNICEVESCTDAFKFDKALSVMEGTYTKICGSEYTFIHDYMFEVLAYHFGSQFPKLVLQYISSSYIANKMKVQEGKKELVSESKQVSENEESSAEEYEVSGSESMESFERPDSFDLCIRLTDDQYPMLAERLYRDIENMELYDVFMNNVLKHPKVCQAFIEVLKTKSYAELKSLFLSVQKDVSKVVSKGDRLREESVRGDECSLEWLRQKLLLRERRTLNKRGVRLTKYCVRVISWVVYYGHSQILQYIVKQTDLHKETEKELIWNFCSPKLSYKTKEIVNDLEKNTSKDNLSLPESIRGKRNQKRENSCSIPEQECLFVLSCHNGDLETVRIFMKYIDIKTINRELKFDSFSFGTPLTAACEGGHMCIVEELLKAGADINPQGGYNTPLTVACRDGQMSVVKKLLEAGADINPQGKHGTPLTEACDSGYISIVKELLRAGADVNQQDEYGTPLSAACRNGQMRVVKNLLRAGANINAQSRHDTPLIEACECGHLSVVKELLKAGADINHIGKYYTPLTAACKGGHISIVKELLESGADINPQGEYCKPLTVACFVGDMNIVKELLKAGADINLQGKHCTALIEACKGGHMSVVKELIEAGADINLQGKYDTPLSAACVVGDMNIVKELLKAGADINLQGKDCTALIEACKCGNMNVVKELIEAGANINANDEHDTPLTGACEGGHLSVVKELLKAGADINSQGDIDTPLTAASKRGHMRVVTELQGSGADINKKAKYTTPLLAARECGHMSAVNVLLEAGTYINQQGEYDTQLREVCESEHISAVEQLLEEGMNVN